VSDLHRIRTDAVAGRRAPAPDPVVAAVRERWAQIVGDAVARHAAPVRTSSGALVVACSSAAWSSELAMLAPTIAERLQAELGLAVELRFEVGELPAPAEPARAPRPGPPDDAAEHAERIAAAVGPAELRESIERAIARTLRG
jgi:predicted nucleic acid-binding Zn ribbon protein